jgi:hypothetical protein
MTVSSPSGRVLSDAQRADLDALRAVSDSVELKLTVPASQHRATLEALRIDPLDAEIRNVFFFDTPKLVLNEAGLVVRARRTQRKGDDTVVKSRPLVPTEVPDEVRSSPNFMVEVDAMPGSFVCSGSMKRTLPQPDVRTTVAGARPLRKLFSKEQRAYYDAHAPAGVVLDNLTVLGPITVFKAKFTPAGFARKLVAEMWMYPDGSRVLELSTKTAPEDAWTAADETRAFLDECGV